MWETFYPHNYWPDDYWHRFEGLLIIPKIQTYKPKRVLTRELIKRDEEFIIAMVSSFLSVRK